MKKMSPPYKNYLKENDNPGRRRKKQLQKRWKRLQKTRIKISNSFTIFINLYDVRERPLVFWKTDD